MAENSSLPCDELPPAMDAKVEYRRLIDAKLTAMGAPPPADTPKETPKTAEVAK